MRRAFALQDFITERHLQNMAKVMLVTGLIVVYGYLIELFMAWYSANQFEGYMAYNRATGPYKWYWYSLFLCNGAVPQLLWIRRFRTNTIWLWIISMFINVGMWLERFIIVVTSLHREFMPSSWGMYYPTFFDWSTFIGTMGLFMSLIFLFVRFLPLISGFEMRHLVAHKREGQGGDS